MPAPSYTFEENALSQLDYTDKLWIQSGTIVQAWLTPQEEDELRYWVENLKRWVLPTYTMVWFCLYLVAVVLSQFSVITGKALRPKDKISWQIKCVPSTSVNTVPGSQTINLPASSFSLADSKVQCMPLAQNNGHQPDTLRNSIANGMSCLASPYAHD